MSATDPVLVQLAASLRTAVETENVHQLREYFIGKNLPAMGGDLSPAEILRQAVSFTREAPDFLPLLARSISSVIGGESAAIANERKITRRRYYLLLNAVDLAADLPAEEHLSITLRQLLAILEGVDDTNSYSLWSSLLRALTYQQIDQSLENRWFSILDSTNQQWDAARRTLLLIAWRGILWIPSSSEGERSDEIIDFFRVARGLRALYKAAKDQEDGPALLKACLEILDETYPRSPEFWVQHLISRILPNEIQVLIHEKWTVEDWPSADLLKAYKDQAAIETKSLSESESAKPPATKSALAPIYPQIHVTLRSRNRFALVSAIRQGLRRAGTPSTEIDRFMREALLTQNVSGFLALCSRWVRLEASAPQERGKKES